MARLERQITVVAVVLPFLGFIVALWLLWGGAVTGLDLAILAVMYVLVGFGVTIGFHRLLHASLVRGQAVAARHARDPRLDVGPGRGHPLGRRPPQAPHLHRRGGRPAQPAHSRRRRAGAACCSGLWHSHMGWLFDGERSSARRFAPDLRKDPLIRKIDTLFPVWALLGLAIPFVARLRPLRLRADRRR